MKGIVQQCTKQMYIQKKEKSDENRESISCMYIKICCSRIIYTVHLYTCMYADFLIQNIYCIWGLGNFKVKKKLKRMLKNLVN